MVTIAFQVTEDASQPAQIIFQRFGFGKGMAEGATMPEVEQGIETKGHAPPGQQEIVIVQ